MAISSSIGSFGGLLSYIVEDLKCNFCMGEIAFYGHSEVKVIKQLEQNKVLVQGKGQSIVDSENLRRPKNSVTKIIIKLFLKEAIKRQDSSWILSDEYSMKFDISASKNRPKRKWPVEDSEVPLYSLGIYADTEFPHRKASNITMNYLSVWSWLFIHSKAIFLFPFSFDDFLNSLNYHMKCPIMDEIYFCLLSMALRYENTLRKKGTLNNYKNTLPSIEGNDWEDTLRDFLVEVATDNNFPRFTQVMAEFCGFFERDLSLKGEDNYTERLPSKSGYFHIKVDDRLAILGFLIDFVSSAPEIRLFHEDNLQNISQLNKVKRDLFQRKKEHASLTEMFNIKYQESNDDGHEVSSDEEIESPSIPFEDLNPLDQEILNLKKQLDDLEQNPDKSNRQQSIKIQNLLKIAENNKKKNEIFEKNLVQKEKMLLMREKMTESKKLDIEKADIEREEQEIEKQIQIFSAGLRVTPLGRDRYWNTYYWFDSLFFDTDFIPNGRLWIEGVGRVPFLGHLSGVRIKGAKREHKDTDQYVTIPGNSGDSLGVNFLSDGELVFIDTIEEVMILTLI